MCEVAEREAMLNGVMVALQILVLSVWVRVLVKQHIMGKIIHSELVLVNDLSQERY